MKDATYNPLLRVRPLDELKTVPWAEENVYLSPRITTPNPGPWRRETVAAMAAPGGPLEALDDPACELVGLCAGAQSAKTLTGYVWLAKEIATDPSGALIVMSSAQVAQDKAREVWFPMWEDSPALRRYLPENRKVHWTKRAQLINKAGVYWAGANSPGALASKSMRRIFGDELDKWPQSFGRGNKHSSAATASEAGAMELLFQRCKAYRQKGLAKILVTSTPTDDLGPIWRVYLAGDQRKLFVPCASCGVFHVMLWASFKIDMTLAKTDPAAAVAGAFYECPHCNAKWGDRERFAAIDAGEWRPTAVPKYALSRTFWFPSWCSKLVNVSYLAQQWLNAQAGRTALQDFLNGESAEAFVHYENSVRDELFAGLEGEYVEGQRWTTVAPYSVQCDPGDSIVIAGVDVQKGYLVATFREFTRGGDSGCVQAYESVASFAALDVLAEKHGAQYVFIDQRYRTREVQEWAHSHAGYIPCLGVTRRARALFTVAPLNIDEGRRSGPGREIVALDYDADMLMDILVDQIQRREGSKRWMIPRGYSSFPEYVAHLTAERSVNGRWVNPGDRPNHLSDAERLSLLGAIWLGYFPVSVA